MAVDSNALSLAQYAQFSNSPLVRRVAYSLYELGGAFADLPLPVQNTLFASGSRFAGDALPDVNWSNINGEPVTVNATPTPFQEQVYIIRNQIDTDNLLVEDRNRITDPRAVRLEAYLKSVNYEMNHQFINGNPVTGNAKSIVGLRYRLDNPTKYGVESELKIDAGGVDMSDSGMTTTTANRFIEQVQQVLDYLGAPDGLGVSLYMNDTLKRRFDRAIRLLGGQGFNTTTDAFDRSVERFKNAVIRDAGRKKDQTTRIITNTETSAGADGASTFTSLYAARYGETHLTGWQFKDLNQAVRDLGLVDNGVIYRTVIDWAVGLFYEDTRCMARLYDIKIS